VNGPKLSGTCVDAALAALLMASCRVERTLIFQNGRANRNKLSLVLSTPSRLVSSKAFGSLSSGMAPMRSASLARFLLADVLEVVAKFQCPGLGT
jgi:hypothetical protein